MAGADNPAARHCGSQGCPGRLRRLGHTLIYIYPAGATPPKNGEAAEKTAPADEPAQDRAGLGPGEVAVRAAWARPLSAPGQEVSLLSADKKREIAWLPSPEALDPESRALLEEELDQGYWAPLIRRVLKTSPEYGYRYWQVETDRGTMDFLSRSPETNVLWQGPHACLIRDVAGNCFRIPDLRALDTVSRAHAQAAL